jgi:branched-chain amino acid aminotransferase
MLAAVSRIARPAASRFAARSVRSVATLDASKIQTALTSSPVEKLPKEDLVFGGSFSDHQLEIDWDAEAGWHAPQIKPSGPLELHPAASSLHYAMQCFEGMKCYVDAEGNLRLFRPDLNMVRMNRSMARLHLPTFDGDQFIECLKELLRVERDWVPAGDGYSLYIRPTGISTHPFLGVGPSQNAKLFAILSPVGPYYPEGFKPVTLKAETQYVRAWPGGTGDAKVGGNYGPTIQPQMKAAEKGYSQVLWLFGDDLEVTEVGTMNMFVFWTNAETGRKELRTAPLDGTILPGVTRQSVLDLAREWGEFDVVEETFTMPELALALDEGRVEECFGCGTAAVVSPICKIGFNGRDYDVPIDPDDDAALAGKLTQRVWDTICDIQYGRVESPWSVVV